MIVVTCPQFFPLLHLLLLSRMEAPSRSGRDWRPPRVRDHLDLHAHVEFKQEA